MEYCYQYNFKPRHVDIDKFGIAHHSKFFCWFEDARYELFSILPPEYEPIIDKYGFPVSRLECKYIRSVNKISNMLINVKLKVNFDIPILHFDYRLLSPDERILYSKAYTEHVLLDAMGQVLHTYPEDVVNLWTHLQELDKTRKK